MSEGGKHVCFGCQKPIQPEQGHIHGKPSQYLGKDSGLMDEIFGDIVYCEPCTVPGGEFWLHRHKIEPPSAFGDLLASQPEEK